MKKLIATGLLSLALLGGQAGSLHAEQHPTTLEVYFAPVHFVFDGDEYLLPDQQRAFIYEGSTYVPLRFVSYALHKAVRWDQDTYTVSVEKPNVADQTTIDDYLVNRKARNSTIEKTDTSKLKPSSLDVYLESVNYVFNGAQPPADLPGMIIDGNLYVPMRFFSESVGEKLDWDQTTYTVAAQTNGGTGTVDSGGKSDVGTTGDKPTAGSSGAAAGAGGAVPGAGGAGGTPAGGSGQAVAYDTIIKGADDQIKALQSNAQSYFLNLFFSYESEPIKDQATKDRYKAQGQAALSGYDSQFEQIMSSLQSQLTAGGYSTDVIAQYRQNYESQKALAKQSIGL